MRSKLEAQWDAWVERVIDDPRTSKAEADFLAGLPGLCAMNPADFEIAEAILEKALIRAGTLVPPVAVKTRLH